MEENKNELEEVVTENEPVEAEAAPSEECAETPCVTEVPTEAEAEPAPTEETAEKKTPAKKGKLVGIIIAAAAIVAAAVVALVLILGGGEEPVTDDEHTHVSGSAVKENITAVTCTADGGYDNVVYCTECEEEISRDHVTVAAIGHSITDTVTAPTCLNAGYTTHTCNNEGCSERYVDTYVDAIGHDWSAPTCKEDRTCAACDATLPALTHDYVLVSSTAASCEAEATATYKCSGCDDEYVEKQGSALGHNISGVTPTAVHVSGCEYVQKYACKSCGATIDGDTVELHNLTSSITTPATCSANGVKTTVCTGGCGYLVTESIEKNSTGHIWTQGAVVDGKRTDTCSNCSETKQVTVYEGTSTGATSSESFKDTEIELNGTGITMDEGVVDALGNKDVTLSADKIEGDDKLDLNLSDDQLAQVGDSPIYNFTISDGNENISNFGENNYVTITIPYTLAYGEDVDNIAIWFISDSGELEAIPAVYNNGFVTFKTNHFSYYTVTRLTPAERCALYGHSDTTKTVAATCLTDGYTLAVCVRCHRSEKTNVIIADGHDFVVENLSATCTTAGKSVSTCADCGYSYESKTPATGHKWEVVSSVEANCQQAGETVYECSACDASYTDKIPQTSHIITDTVVAPTCEADGYTLHECDSCDYSYTDTVVAAIGHAYTVVFVWADDLTTAKAQLTCANDAAHNTEIDAQMTVNTIDATCSGGTVYEYTATVTVNGSVYTEMQSKSEGEPNHTYGDAWLSDETNHWHECVCGSRDALAAHDYSSESVTTAPTCVADGVMTYTCVCGKSTTEQIPATGEHTYVDGICTGCGAQNNTCDHTTLHREYIEMADYGFCPGIVNYFSCDCGEVLIFDEDHSDLNCEAEYRDQVMEETEYGEYATAIIACSKCSMTAKVEGWMTENECTQSVLYEYSFYEADGITPIKEKVRIEEVDYDHADQRKNIAVGCGGTITVNECTDCGKIVMIQSIDVDCADAPEFDLDVDMVPGQDFVFLYEHNCADCGIYVKYEVSMDFDGCTCSMDGNIYLAVNGEVISDYSEVMTETDHDYEYTYELLGATCEDGVKEIATCKNCGDVVHSIENGHSDYEYDAEIDLSEYSDCYVLVTGNRCRTCGAVTYIEDFEFSCDIPEVTPENVIGDNGEVIGQRASYTCADCGLTFVQTMLDYNETPCISVESMQMKIYVGDTCIFDYDDTNTSTEHEYERTGEMIGATCDDGILVHSECTKCGYTYDQTSHGHYYHSERFELSEYGLCGGYYERNFCVGCGVEGRAYINDYDCRWYGHSVMGQEVPYLTCEVCGTKKVQTSTTSDKDSDCEVTVDKKYEYYRGEELLFTLETTEWQTLHDYDRSYILYGDSCEDGYKITFTCKDCGHSYSYDSTYHSTAAVKSYDLSEYGACSGEILLYACPCGEETWLSFNDSCAHDWNHNTYVDEQGRVHNVETRMCRDCGLRYDSDRYVIHDSATCNDRYYYAVTISVGNNAVDTFSYQDLNEAHNYKTTGTLLGGSTCEDGVLIERVCKDCGYSYSDVYNYHETYEINRYNTLSLGSACGGDIVEYSCACGADHGISFENLYCNMDSQWVEPWIDNAIIGWVDDIYYDYDFYDMVCSVTDPDCDFVIRYACYYVEDGCRAVQYITYLIGYNEHTGAYESEITFATGNVRAYHDYVTEDISGIEDGLSYEGTAKTCSKCDAHRTTKRYLNADGYVCKEVIEYVDELGLGGDTYSIEIREYFDEDLKATERYYLRTVHSDGTETIREEKYIMHGGYNYITENYRFDRGYWEKYTYSYDFSNCTATVTYTDIHGKYNVNEESAHKYSWYIIDNPTCTQHGREGTVCLVCDQQLDVYDIEPIAHHWEWFDAKGIYVCALCGLENANGASGEIVMEDLTEYDGDNYVVGYWCRDEYLEFTYYVEIVVGDDFIILDGVNVTLSRTPRAYVFSKSEVAALAQKLGYSEGEYVVRFVAVPYGADGSYDYAITFSAPPVEGVTYVEDDALLKCYPDAKRHAEITLYADEASQWEIYSYSSSDVCVYVYDENGNEIAYDDDRGISNNFYVNFYAEKGTYTVCIYTYDRYSEDGAVVTFNKI